MWTAQVGRHPASQPTRFFHRYLSGVCASLVVFNLLRTSHLVRFKYGISRTRINLISDGPLLLSPCAGNAMAMGGLLCLLDDARGDELTPKSKEITEKPTSGFQAIIVDIVN
eukprot:scaffold9060_cov72-Skeletonema_dohrnii-CCMP3373.AAC.2